MHDPTTQPPPGAGPDFYARLADDLTTLAGKVRQLSGTGLTAPRRVNFSVLTGLLSYEETDAVAIVDAFAGVLGVEATTTIEGRGASRLATRTAETTLGALDVKAYARLTAPPTRAEKAASLARENKALRARLAELEGGQGK